MTKRQRVLAALQHRQPDQIPKGETWIDARLANRIMNTDYPLEYQSFERDKAIRDYLEMDLINVGDWPQQQIGISKRGNPIYRSNYGYEFEQGESKHVIRPPVDEIEKAYQYKKPDIANVDASLVKRYVSETELFVFAQIGGPVSMLDEMFAIEDYMVFCLTNTQEIAYITEKVMEYEVEKAKLFIDAGCHGIFFADDIAFNTGTFLPPYIMHEIVYPFYRNAVKEIKGYKDLPIVFHSDGNLNTVLDDIVACGFDGLQSIQPSAGMNIKSIKEKYGSDLCLWGNIDLDYIMSFAPPEEVKQNVKETIRIAGEGGGFILSTCNTMIDSIPEENVMAMMDAATECSYRYK